MNDNKSKIKHREKDSKRKSLEPRETIKPKINYQNRVTNNDQSKNSNQTILENITDEAMNTTVTQAPQKKSFVTKFILFTSFCTLLVFITLNFTPIVNYVIKSQESNIFPVLKKYADQLRDISQQLTVVTRRLNMLSLISEENELHDNNIKIGEIALQINELWMTTKKYLKYLGIETIANTKLEKEIDINSNIQSDDEIRTNNSTKEIFPVDKLTITSILRLDSVVTELNIKIKNLNSEINYLEEQVYTSINVSNIYTQLLDRNRRDNSNFYAEPNMNSDIELETDDQNPQYNEELYSDSQETIETIAPKELKPKPILQQAKKMPASKIEKQANVTKKLIIEKPSPKLKKIISTKLPTADPKPIKKIKQAPKKIAKIDTKFKKKSGLNKPQISKTIESNKPGTVTTQKPKSDTTPKFNIEPVFENSELLDDIIYDYVSSYGDNEVKEAVTDYEEDEEEDESQNTNNPIEDDDYTGG